MTFQNAGEVMECLESLGRSNADPAFDLYLCENGGDEAFAELCARACAADGPCARSDEPPPCRTDGFKTVEAFELKQANARVFIGNAGENLGYGGGVNRWLGPLRQAENWPGALVLNPDTTVDPDALSALTRYAKDHGKGMVTGRIVLADDPSRIHTRGLRWRRFMASAKAIGRNEPAASRPSPGSVERQLDAPVGAFVYVTRACLDKIGLMEERYFLYFEDLDWGLRAKRRGDIGYAFDSVVYHKGGTTIGTGPVTTISEFATYLSFRNRVLFVYANFPAWLIWTALIAVARALEYGFRGRTGNMRVALRGTLDGLLRRNGRPDELLSRHLVGKAPE